MKKYKILTINPGSTSTKIGLFENEKIIFEYTVRHSSNIIEKYDTIWEQYTFRKEEIVSVIEQKGYDLKKLNAVVGRGGLVKPIPSGTYTVDEEMIQDARIGFQGQHASNLGCVIAYSIGWQFDIPSYIVDPPSVDDFEPLAKVSGFAEFERSSLLHALNIFATARKYAKQINKKFTDLNLIVTHLGGGISVAALRNGKAINSNNGLDEGPFTPERSGSLPQLKLIKMCLSGKYTETQIKKMIVGKGGLVSYFNTNKAHEVENMAIAGSEKFKLIYEAMAYQIAEAIGARATNLKGKVDAIILTGGIAHSDLLNNWIIERVSHIAKVHIYPGELELEALASAAVRALDGEETVKRYKKDIHKIGVYYWQSIEAYISVINYIEDIFREKGYTFRKRDNNNISFKYENCKRNEAKARKAIENFIDDDVDVIFAIGSPASIRAVQYLKDTNIPVICTGLYSTAALGETEWQNNKNFLASCYGVELKEQIENTISKFPYKFKKIGIPYRIGELQSNIEHDEIREYCRINKIKHVSFDIQNHEDFNDATAFFKKEKVDWVYIGSDSLTATATSKQLKLLTSTFPTFCVLGDTITHGGLISYHVSWKDICAKAGDFGIKILNGLEINNSTEVPKNKIITVNEERMKKFKLTEQIAKLKNVKFV